MRITMRCKYVVKPAGLLQSITLTFLSVQKLYTTVDDSTGCEPLNETRTVCGCSDHTLNIVELYFEVTDD